MHPQKKIKYLPLSLVLIITTVTFLQSCTSGLAEQKIHWQNVSLNEADIAFRTGRSMASRIVLASDTEGYYSHVGIIVKQNNKYMVIHAVPGESRPGEPDKVKMEALEQFYTPDKAKAGKIMRLNIDPELKTTITQYALQSYKNQTHFDHNYNLNDSTKLYCTELIWRAYKTAGIDITNNKTRYINFSVFKGNMIFPSHIQNNEKLISIFSFNNH